MSFFCWCEIPKDENGKRYKVQKKTDKIILDIEKDLFDNSLKGEL